VSTTANSGRNPIAAAETGSAATIGTNSRCVSAFISSAIAREARASSSTAESASESSWLSASFSDQPIGSGHGLSDGSGGDTCRWLRQVRVVA
jgi:hypothetical protein